MKHDHWEEFRKGLSQAMEAYCVESLEKLVLISHQKRLDFDLLDHDKSMQRVRQEMFSLHALETKKLIESQLAVVSARIKNKPDQKCGAV